jgi:hypothetical protein
MFLRNNGVYVRTIRCHNPQDHNECFPCRMVGMLGANVLEELAASIRAELGGSEFLSSTCLLKYSVSHPRRPSF